MRRLILIAALVLCSYPASHAQTIFTGTFSGSGTAIGGPCTTPGPVSASATVTATVQPALSTLVSSGGTATGFFVITNAVGTGCGEFEPNSGTVSVTVAPGGATTLVADDGCKVTLTGTTTSLSGDATVCVGLTTGSATVSVTAQPAITAPATLRVTPSALRFTGVAGGGAIPAQAINVINDSSFQNNISGVWSGRTTDGQASGSLNATFVQTGGSLKGALSVTDPSGTFSTDLAGTIVGTSFTFTSTGLPGGAFITGQGSLLNASLISGTFVNSSRPNEAFFSINRQSPVPGAASPLNWTVQTSTTSGGSWLTATPTSGTSNAGFAGVGVNVSAQTTGLAPGTYNGTVQVSAPAAANSPLSVSVILNVLPAASPVDAQVRPTGVIFVGGTAAPGPQNVQITTVSASTVQATFAATTNSGGNWLGIDKTSASLSSTSPVTLSVSVSNALPSGVYQGQVAISFSDGRAQQFIQVILVMPASTSAGFKLPGASACTATRLLTVDRTLGANFNSPISWPTTLEVVVVDDCGGLINQARVVATFSNGDAPLLLQMIGSARYQGTWRPVNAGSPVTVKVTATLGTLTPAEVVLNGRTSDNPNVPAVNPGGMVGAANYGGTTLPPGGIIAIFGKNLAQTGAAANLPLPTNLGGVTLTAAGKDLPLFYSSAGQVNAQLPTELAAGTRVAVIAKTTVGNNAVLSVPELITIGPTAPGIFSVSQDGKGQGVIVDASNRLLDGVQAAATSGQVVVIYCTGLGATTPAVASGVAAPANPLARVDPTPVVSIGGKAATVQFAGMTPGLVGLYQLNVLVPAGVSGPAVPVSITHQGVTSNAVTMVVR